VTSPEITYTYWDIVPSSGMAVLPIGLAAVPTISSGTGTLLILLSLIVRLCGIRSG
jgi:hypothetical protein